MVNSLNGISAADYQAYMKVQNQIINGNVSTPNLTYANDSTQFSTSGCTDGKDDGKIGIFSAIGNTIKGVGKTVVNGVKGMFTGKDGKFSLGKTLLSVATAAACVAFPAVGLAACVVGGTMGAIQVGKGVINAATAKTDAEAKQAWQDIGGGAFTVGVSVVGAKAGVKAVKSSSTAGIPTGKGNQLALQNTSGNQVALPGTTGGSSINTSALGNLPKNATFTQKISALGKDMISSTQNNYTNIKTTTQNYATVGKWIHDVKQYMKNGNGENLIDDGSYNNLKLRGQDIIKNEGTKKAFENISNASKQWHKAKGYVTKDNAQTLWNGIQEAYNNNIKGNSISMLAKGLRGAAKNIWADLSDGKYSYQEVVNKYGYKNVAELIEYMGITIYGTATA